MSSAVSKAGVAGRELGHAEITSNATRASTTPADVAGLSTTVTVGSRPIEVVFSCGAVSNGNATAGVAVKILEGSTVKGGAVTFVADAGVAMPLNRRIRLSPAAGSYTYKIQLAAFVAGTATISADTGATYGPASISVVEL